jgi:hypothetical protein
MMTAKMVSTTTFRIASMMKTTTVNGGERDRFGKSRDTLCVGEGVKSTGKSGVNRSERC